jgi:pimeloyl-ACP methyl ester carboxylesterase
VAILGAPATMRLDDARTLAWSEAGDPDGEPVVACHGTPGSRHQLLVDDAPIRAAGVRWIVPDRPGYGLSTYQPDRRLAGWARDVTQLADQLGLERFAVLGLSGGGPHAAACAALLPGRVTATAIVSGVAPLIERGSERGMMPPNRLFARLARRAPTVNRIPFGAMALLGRRAPDRLLTAMAKQAPVSDAVLLRRPDVADAFRRDLGEASRTTGRAAAQDFELIAHDWGFRLEDITGRVDVWQADHDINVPVEHARRQARAIPDAELHLVAGEGHFMIVDHLEEILRALVGGGDGRPNP